jgi:hypothetical protein
MGSSNGLDRRRFFHACAGFGLAGAVVETLWAAAGEGPITRETLAVARAYQEATGFHLRHPALRAGG